MSAENTPDPLADLYFDPQAVADAQREYGPFDTTAIQEVLADPYVRSQIALLGIASQIAESNDPKETLQYERSFKLFADAAKRTYGERIHTIALHLARQAIDKQRAQPEAE